MSTESSGLKALKELTREAREQPLRELDWERIENRVMARLHAPPVARQAPRPRATWLLLPLAAALAALLLIPGLSEGTLPEATTSSASASTSLNGDQLDASEVIESRSGPLAIEHPGRARWTLTPNSRARVLSRGDVIRIALDEGELRAEVVPAPVPERFVVESAGTRVAVHGTIFSVRRASDRTLVDVESGVVVVSSIAHAGVEPRRLLAGDHGEFNLLGFEWPQAERAGKTAAMPSPVRRAPGSTLPIKAAEAVKPPANDLTIGEAEEGFAPVFEAVQACFQTQTPGQEDRRVMLRTELKLDIAADGQVQKASFTPPLLPTLQSCADEAVSKLRFAPTTEGVSLLRVIELTR